MANVDVLYIHRYCSSYALRLARAVRERGAAVVWDNDDDIGAIPKAAITHRRLGGFAWSRRVLDMQRLFRWIDLVTAPNPTLAERLGRIGAPRTEVIENYIPDRFLHAARSSHQGVTIGWIAGLEHQVDVERLPIRAALQQLLEDRAEVSVVSVGLALGLHGERYRHIDGVDLAQLCDHVAGFDIGIAPLSDIDFNRSRSNVKLKEYAAAGTPWLASPIGPYAGMGERQGGQLVADDRWLETLTRLVDKPRERRKLAKQAARWAADQTFSKNVHVWEAMLTRAVERTAAPVG